MLHQKINNEFDFVYFTRTVGKQDPYCQHVYRIMRGDKIEVESALIFDESELAATDAWIKENLPQFKNTVYLHDKMERQKRKQHEAAIRKEAAIRGVHPSQIRNEWYEMEHAIF